MRMGTLLFGGLIGAGAVIYWNRRGKQMAFSAVSHQTGNMMNRMMNRGSKMERSEQQPTSKASNSFKVDPAASMKQVEDIVNKDPELKRNVDEILHSNQNLSHKEPSPAMTQ